MAQIRKLEFEVEIQSSADKFYDVFKNKAFLVPTMSPQQLQLGKPVQGDGKSVGSIRVWNYVAAGNIEIVKDVVEGLDDESKTVTLNMLEGNVLKFYKSFKSIMRVTETGLVKWTLEFEKENESIPDPIKYKAFLTAIAKNVDAYLLNHKTS